jgi:tRNA G18 (ribose-2'-O)-methylase SpoU
MNVSVAAAILIFEAKRDKRILKLNQNTKPR